MYYISCYCNEYHTTTKTTLCIVSCVVCTEKCLIVAQIISKQTFTKNLVKIYKNYFEPWSLTLSLLKHPRCWQSILQEKKIKDSSIWNYWSVLGGLIFLDPKLLIRQNVLLVDTKYLKKIPNRLDSSMIIEKCFNFNKILPPWNHYF